MKDGRTSLTEQEKLELVMRVADRVARKYRIADPCELWGAGWEGIRVAEVRWDKVRPFAPFANSHVEGRMRDSLRVRRIHRVTVAFSDLDLEEFSD